MVHGDPNLSLGWFGNTRFLFDFRLTIGKSAPSYLDLKKLKTTPENSRLEGPQNDGLEKVNGTL